MGLCHLYVSLEEYFQALLDMSDLATFLRVLIIVLRAGTTMSVLDLLRRLSNAQLVINVDVEQSNG